MRTSLRDSYRIQTYNLLIRSQMLYSVELTSRCASVLSRIASAKVRLSAELAKRFGAFFLKKVGFAVVLRAFC